MPKPIAPYWVRIRSAKMKPRSRMRHLECRCCTAFNHIAKKKEKMHKKDMQDEINWGIV